MARGFSLNLKSQALRLVGEVGSFLLVSVDLPAGLILLLVELPLLGLGQMTIVSGHISLLLVVDLLLPISQVSSLSRRQGAVPLAIGNAVLLIPLTRIDFVDAWMIRINHSRSRAGYVAVSGLSSGGAHAEV